MRRIALLLFVVVPVISLPGLSGCSKARHRQNAESIRPAAAPAEKKEPQKPPKPQKEFIKAKGLHVTGWIAGSKKRFAHLVSLCDKTELNTLVIDIKESDGRVTFDTNVPLEREVGASAKMVSDIDGILKIMKEHNIYPIARIVCFKDKYLPKKKPELGVQSTGGGLWKDRAGYTWLNPYDRRNWDYNIDLAIECAKRGFKEIQWDYVRFPSDGRTSTCVFPNKTAAAPNEVITQFLKYSKERLEPYGVVITADLFGLTSLVDHDMGIGQVIQDMAKYLDYICPMVYPSHYARGEYGMPNPDVQPYKTVLLSLRDALKRVEGTDCKIRPWLQDFSLYSHYGKEEVLAQRKAAKELGITEFLLWNASCRYTESALTPEKAGGGDVAKAAAGSE